VAPSALHVAAVQPHWPSVPPPPQDWGSWQPQKICPPQLLENEPHEPGAHAAGVQHMFAVTLQTSPGPVQRLQLSIPPHPSGNEPPQLLPATWAHVIGLQGGPQTPLVLQTFPSPHAPQ
jgi:hypothetical protein